MRNEAIGLTLNGKDNLTSILRRVLTALMFNILSWLAFLLVVAALYFAFLRDMQMTWGATDDDVNRAMMGDELLIDPEMNATRAIEIKATPEEIWPWVVQMGCGRAGYYGFDNLDNAGASSSDSILAEHQELKVGDSIPGGIYKGKTWYLMGVGDIEPGKEMLWVFAEGTPWSGATWSWGLYPIDDERTRLVARLRQKYALDSFQGVVSSSLIDATEILMMRTTLRGIKLRAERP